MQVFGSLHIPVFNLSNLIREQLIYNIITDVALLFILLIQIFLIGCDNSSPGNLPEYCFTITMFVLTINSLHVIFFKNFKNGNELVIVFLTGHKNPLHER